MSMSIIKPVSDLRDYNKVLKECSKGGPVILTKNGRGMFVVLSLDEYDDIMVVYNSRPNTQVAQSACN